MASSLVEAARVFRRPRSRLPYIILTTDESRGGDPLAAAARLPRGAAVILRHDGVAGRAALAASVARICRARGLALVVARDEGLAIRLRAGLHLAEGMRPGVRFRLARRRSRALLTMAAHGKGALARARNAGADLALLSPLFPTASHPGAPSLGTLRFASLARAARVPIAALGGMTQARISAARRAGACSVAAIGALSHPA